MNVTLIFPDEINSFYRTSRSENIITQLTEYCLTYIKHQYIILNNNNSLPLASG